MQDLVQHYLATWNETDTDTRRALIERHWADDPRYTDPLAEVRGRDQLDATIAAVQGQFPGFVFTALSEADSHHAQARFTWGLGPADAPEPVVVGFDVVTTDADGRIETVLGFLDRVPG
jgi:hypothetical protein